MQQDEQTQTKDRMRVVRVQRWLTVIVLVLLLTGLGRVHLARQSHAEFLTKRAEENAILRVRVVKPDTHGFEAKLTLPGTLQGIEEVQIHARISGYVRQWLKDIGQTVKKGELLAILDIPEVNKQVEEANANHALAKTAYDRWKKLRSHDAVSEQEYDEKLAALKQTEAIRNRLQDQQKFGNITAPFDGIVTKRNVENGDLVNAGNGGVGQSMFVIAQMDTLHLYVHVPQDRATRVTVGDQVTILRPEASDQSIKGVIVRSARAIDPIMRTLQVEIQVANADLSLLPGSYVEVVLALKSDGGLLLPTNTLLFGPGGSRVAIAQPDGTVTLQSVSLGTDHGHKVAIKSGIKPDDQVILNPPDSISAGQRVRVIAESSPKEK